ncbi:MAG: GNAT family N-acetyltransferase [Clostridia bacterium]|nr:GNAT family N-acetyltransferase [Clostridia bacterium]
MIVISSITSSSSLNHFLVDSLYKYSQHPAPSFYRTQCQPFGIYEGEKMVGYVIVIYDYDVPEYDVWHMMIDESAQGRGYGGAALDRVLNYIRTKPFGSSDRVALTCNKENPIARKLYESRGFQPTGAEYDDEIELAMMLT